MNEKTQNAQRTRLTQIDHHEEFKEEDTLDIKAKELNSTVPPGIRDNADMLGVGTSAVEDDHVMVRELAARAIARLVLGDPKSRNHVLRNPNTEIDRETKDAMVRLFEEAALTVHKPLVVHKGGGIV